MKKKYLAGLPVVGLIATLALTGCSSSGGGSAGSPSCTPKDAKIQTITPGTLTVGAIDIPPFSSYNSGDPKGVDVDIVKKYASEECLTIAWKQASFADAIQSISGGTLDIAIGTIDRTVARQKVVDYSSTIYLDEMSIASKTGANTVTELEKMGNVGIVNGYLEIPDLTKILGSKLKIYPSSVQLMADFEAGRINAAIDNYGTQILEYKGKKDVKVEIALYDKRVQALVRPPQAAIPLTKGNTSLNDSLSKAIVRMREAGEIQGWLKKAGLSPKLIGTEEQLKDVYSVK